MRNHIGSRDEKVYYNANILALRAAAMIDPNYDTLTNWSRGPIKLYFNRADMRLFVPKHVASAGWTFNLAHPAAALVMLTVMVLPTVLVAFAPAIVRIFH